jgi:hypothetical protein
VDRAQQKLIVSWACLRVKHVLTRPAVQHVVEVCRLIECALNVDLQVMDEVFSEINEGYLQHVCNVLSRYSCRVACLRSVVCDSLL